MLAWPRRARMPPPGRPAVGLALGGHVALARRAPDLHARVLPGGDVVLLGLVVPAREQTVEVLGVGEVLVDDGAGVRVAGDVLAELASVLEDVVDDAPEKGDVCAGP